MLAKIEIPSSVDRREILTDSLAHLRRDIKRIEAFQDRWDRPQIEQFVAADFYHVYQALDWTLETQMMIGRRMLEWGCGFAVVTAMGAALGLDVIGIEAESDLMPHASETVDRWNVQAELVNGNFLPDGAEEEAIDGFLPSLNHDLPSAYEALGLDLDDFALVYSYPWPGEDRFHRAIFERYGAQGALLMMFCGPNDIQLFRKQPRA